MNKYIGSKRLVDVNPREAKAAIEKLQSLVANNPTLDIEDIIRFAQESGYGNHLIDAALGDVIAQKSNISLGKNLEDILNQAYETDPTPGFRYIIDPSKVESEKAKELLKKFPTNETLGLAEAYPVKGKKIHIPDVSLVKEKKSDLGKLIQLSTAGHELKHQKDFLTRPLEIQDNPRSFEPGHHVGEIFEPAELKRQVRDLPEADLSGIAKTSERLKLKATPWRKLAGFAGPLAILGALGLSEDASAALLGDSELISPEISPEVDWEPPYEAMTNPEEAQRFRRWSKIKKVMER